MCFLKKSDFDFLGGEIVHYPLSNGVDEASEQFFFAKRVLARCELKGLAMAYMNIDIACKCR